MFLCFFVSFYLVAKSAMVESSAVKKTNSWSASKAKVCVLPSFMGVSLCLSD